MKLIPEVREWVEQAALQYEDPAIPVCQVFARFASSPPATPTEEILCRTNGTCGVALNIIGTWMPMPIDVEGPRVNDQAELEAFGVRQIAPHLWVLEPSLNIPGLIHAFVTLYGVPEPAPWVSRIIVVSAMSAIGGSLR